MGTSICRATMATSRRPTQAGPGHRASLSPATKKRTLYYSHRTALDVVAQTRVAPLDTIVMQSKLIISLLPRKTVLVS